MALPVDDEKPRSGSWLAFPPKLISFQFRFALVVCNNHNASRATEAGSSAAGPSDFFFSSMDTFSSDEDSGSTTSEETAAMSDFSQNDDTGSFSFHTKINK